MASETTQQAPTPAKPQKEHRWLQRLVGEWTFEGEASMGPDKSAEKFTGKESVRSLGGLWILGEGEGEVPGGVTNGTILTLGYDPQKKRFAGTFISTMMANLWVYEGQLDTTERVLTLDCEGPSMTEDGGMAMYQDIIELVSDDHRILRSRVRGNDGQWQEFMVAHYRRKK
jgi:Protein of unknown function (DUF1579)